MACNHYCSQQSPCITTVPVFKGLDDSELLMLQNVTRSRSFQKGEFIFREGEQSETLLIVNEGLIKLTKNSPDGKEQIIRLLFPGDFFGLFALLRDEKHYMNAEALGKTVICYIDKKDFLQTMAKNADMALRLVVALNDRLYEADESVGFLSLMNVEERLARSLILFYEKMQAYHGAFSLPITKKDLASFIGTTPETVSRKLLSFVSKNMISLIGQRQIEILDMEKLKQIAAGVEIQ